MRHRRFGRTDLAMPVFSLGGMRYQQSWQDVEWSEIPAEGQANLEATVRAAVERGICHIETARGYGSSERQLGALLPKLPRERLIVQTKVGPQEDGAAFRRVFETSLERLQLDHVDLLAIHGINNRALLEQTLLPDGSLAAARRLQGEGRCRFVGFSTHAPLDVIVEAVESDLFDYVNLHYYWADPLNLPAVLAAAEMDLGVFIISPNDKGGQLHRPPEKLAELCRPLTPMAFGDLYCLRRPAVHTLSLGAARPSDLDAHLEALSWLDRVEAVLPPILERLEHEAVRQLGRDWVEGWWRGLPPLEATPGGVNLYHALRLYTLAKAYDMVDYGRWRYNLLGSGGHWFAGNKVDRLEWAKLPAAVARSPVAEQIPEALREAHAMFDAEAGKRLSESG